MAPISGVVVYQYQTGNINTLFNEDDVFPKVSEDECDIASDIARLLCSNHTKIIVRYGQPSLDNIPWNELEQYTSILYCWHEYTDTQIIVAEKDVGSYIRMVQDELSFSRTMMELRAKIKNPILPCNQGHPLEKCLVQVISELPWMEIVNEQRTEAKFVIIWEDDNPGRRKCYIVPVKGLKKPFRGKNDRIRHRIHTYVRNIDVNYKTGKVISIPEDTMPSNEVEGQQTLEKKKEIEELRVRCQPLQVRISFYISEVKEKIEQFEGTITATGELLKKKQNEIKKDNESLTTILVSLSEDDINDEELERISRNLTEIEERVNNHYEM